MTERSNLLELILDEIPALIFILDPNGKITFANKTALEIFGYSAEIIGKLNIIKLLDHSSFNQLLEERKSLDLGNPPQLKIYNLISSKGEVITVEGLAARIESESEPIFLGVAYDISDRLKIENERAELQFQIMKLQKWDILTHLISGLVHDINNYAIGISGYLELFENLAAELVSSLDKTSDLPADFKTKILKIQEKIPKMGDYLEKMHSMNEQILNFAKQEETVRYYMPINLAIQSSIDVCQHSLRQKNIRITFKAGENIPFISANPNEIQRVILNILLNAIDAIPEKKQDGQIVVNLRKTNLTADNIPKVSKLRPGNYLAVEISDNGIGMNEETRWKIFEPFFTKKFDKGTGLGLSISANIIKTYDGWIDCQSQERKGTVFTIYLPIANKKR